MKLEKSSNHKFWIAKIWLLEELLTYQYPFDILNLFQEKWTKDPFQVRVKFLQVLSLVSLEKPFLISEFFENYGSTLSNQNKTKIKKEFIDLVEFFQTQNLIENHSQMIWNGPSTSTDKLTSSNISEGFLIIEKLDYYFYLCIDTN